MAKTIRVMIVDDSPALRTVLAALVGQTDDLEVVASLMSAQGLVEEVERSRPDVVLLDVSMPGPDALQAAKALSTSHPDARVLVFSAYDDQTTSDRAYEAGAWGFLSKHGDPTAILDAVRQVAAGEALFG